ncbi:helix-turn-helix domain-containing protein [Priestia aryabhattai]
MERKLLKIVEVAKILNVTEARAYTMVREGLLPVVRLGRHVRIDKEKLIGWIDNGGQSLPGGWKRDL